MRSKKNRLVIIALALPSRIKEKNLLLLLLLLLLFTFTQIESFLPSGMVEGSKTSLCSHL